MSEDCDIAVVGGGAAGLAAAIFAAQTARQAGKAIRVHVFDSAKSLGAKILVSGGGRCNVTNVNISPADYNGSRNLIRNILAAFDERKTVEWFGSLGIELKTEETGKLFPTTDSARTVLNALLDRCRSLDVQIVPDCRIQKIVHDGGFFLLGHPTGVKRCTRLILATGGRSLPKTGSDGNGYNLARGLGHTVTDTFAALVPLVLEESFIHPELMGVSIMAELSIFVDRKVMDRRTGSLLFTHFGISGPVAMDASRHFIAGKSTGGNIEMRCNFLPGESLDSMDRKLIELVATRNKMAVVNTLGTMLPKRVAEVLCGYAHIPEGMAMSHLTKDLRRELGRALTELVLPVVRDRGWNYAEVTAGGVPLSEVDYRSMESRKTEGLHLVGELLDVDGRIGGFNFQWAWATGYLAGMAAVKSI